MHPRTVATLPIVVRSFTGAALGFAIVGISTEDLVAAIAAALVGALIVGAVGGLILSTTAWAMISGALVGGLALGIASILVTGISKTAIYGAFLGAPLGASLASRLGLRIEAMVRMRRKQADPPSDVGLWDREFDSGRKGVPMGGPGDYRGTVRRRRPIRVLLVVVAIALGLLVLSLFGLFPWSGINCWQDDIDLASGRTRHTRYLLWVPMTRSVQDSALTRALSPEDRANLEEDWHPVVTLSPGLHHSPHYRFHGPIHQIRELEFSWEVGKMTPAARRETARQVLRLWRQTGSYFPAGEYIQKVWERAREAEKVGKSIDVTDLPAP
jgi:hypothetical protein